jgi:aminoglycoside 3-N-acetyltransferase I
MSSPKFFSIRELQRQDVALMNAMMVMFADSFGDADTYTSALPGKNYLERLLGSKHFIALVALAGKTVVGGLTAYELQKYEQERSEIYIYDLAVAADCRRQGIATALMSQLKAIAVSRGVYVIFVGRSPGHTGTVALCKTWQMHRGSALRHRSRPRLIVCRVFR